MRLCLFRHPTLTPERPRLGLLRASDVVDLNSLCAASLLGHIRPRRAAEIADALCPPDLLSFLEGGRHGWAAISDSLARLGPRLDVAPPVGPDGDQVVVAKDAVRLVPLVPAGAGWASTTFGEWGATPVPSPGSDVIVALHTDGRAYLPEYLAVVGEPGEPGEIGLVAIVRPSRPESACVLLTLDDAEVEEPGIGDALSGAIAAASPSRQLLAGDIVRTGPPMVTAPASRLTIDLTEAATVDVRTPVDQRTAVDEIIPAS